LEVVRVREKTESS